MGFQVTHAEVDAHTCVVSVEGELDLASAPQLKWTLVELLDEGYGHYVIDLSQLTHMDSMGLGVLVGFRKRVEGNARLALAGVPPTQAKLFEMTGLDACFDTFASLEAALSTPAATLPLRTDAAMVLGLAATAMPFAASHGAEALRWLRILRLHGGEAARVLCALGIGETPLADNELVDVSAPAEPDERVTRDPVAAVSDLAVRLARKRGAATVGTGDILLAVLRFYGPEFDRVLAAHGTDRDEVIDRLAA